MNPDFETLREEMEQVLGGLDERQTQLRPNGDPSRWNMQQTVEHLLMTYAATSDVLDTRIEKGIPTRTQPSLSQRVGQLVVIRAGLFPKGRTAPDRVTPAADQPAVGGATLLERMGVALQHLDRKMIAAERIFGESKRSVSHIILGPLSIRQWRRFHLIHGRHHIKFVTRIRREFGV